MPLSQKQQHLKEFLFKKFTLDPRKKCMTPADLSHYIWRNEACWVGFWLYDAELDGLVQDIMSDYKVWHTERSDGYLIE